MHSAPILMHFAVAIGEVHDSGSPHRHRRSNARSATSRGTPRRSQRRKRTRVLNTDTAARRAPRSDAGASEPSKGRSAGKPLLEEPGDEAGARRELRSCTQTQRAAQRQTQTPAPARAPEEDREPYAAGPHRQLRSQSLDQPKSQSPPTESPSPSAWPPCRELPEKHSLQQENNTKTDTKSTRKRRPWRRPHWSRHHSSREAAAARGTRTRRKAQQRHQLPRSEVGFPANEIQSTKTGLEPGRRIPARKSNEADSGQCRALDFTPGGMIDLIEIRLLHDGHRTQEQLVEHVGVEDARCIRGRTASNHAIDVIDEPHPEAQGKHIQRHASSAPATARD